MRYTRVYADPMGESHYEDVAVTLVPIGFAPPAPPGYTSPRFSPQPSTHSVASQPGG
jgi:hypothetical protein